MARWKARGQLPISANWIFLASSHGCGSIKLNLTKSASSEVVGHFEHKLLVDGDVARNRANVLTPFVILELPWIPNCRCRTTSVKSLEPAFIIFGVWNKYSVHRSYNTSVNEQVLFQLDSPFLDVQSAVLAADILLIRLTSIVWYWRRGLAAAVPTWHCR